VSPLAIFQDNPAAAAFGTIGLVCQLVWPLFRRHRAILSVQFGIGASYSLHYALIDAWSGAGVAGLGATQSAIAILAGDRPWLRWVGLACLPVVVAICYATWSGLPTMFALAAVTLIIIGRMQRDTLQLRLLLLTAAPFGMGYDILVGAAPALVGGIVSTMIASAMVVREIRLRSARRAGDSRSVED
jgi:hypothetical protein